MSCKQNNDNTGNVKNRIQYLKIDTVKPNVENTKNITLETQKSEISLDTLIPIEVLKKQSKNVYKIWFRIYWKLLCL